MNFGGEARRVLVVEDDADCLLLVTTALSSRPGFHVAAEATTGQAALEEVTRSRPDIVVLDLGLPDISGFDLIPRLRAAAPGLTVVIFSANGDSAARADALAGGADHYVEKGGSIGQLLDALEGLPGTREASLVLPAALHSVRAAREFVRDACLRWDLVDLTDTATLVVSELVTNAVRHASSAPTIRVTIRDHAVRIEVDDEAPSAPAPVIADDEAESGRGLFLIDALCAAWGVSPQGTGKTVWAELAREQVG